MGFTVGDVARMGGVTVRTLHHYDQIGLLAASGRSRAGYRLYEDADLVRLQRILCYRELGFDLDQIAAVLDEPGTDPTDHLRRQHGLLVDRIDRLQRMAATVTKMMEARQMGINLEPDEILEAFGDFDPAEHAQEAEERWGDTDAYKQSQRRTSQYTKNDWIKIKAEGAAVVRGLVACMGGGAAPDSLEAMDLAEEHRQQIHRWFYDLPYEMHVGLGQMYVSDPRFTKTYDDQAPGLAQYLCAAIAANAARAAG